MLLRTTLDKRVWLYRAAFFVVSSILVRIICLDEIILEISMQKVYRITIVSLFVLALAAMAGCATPPAEGSRNADATARSQPEENPSQPKVANEGTPTSQQHEGTGDIEVKSDPPGAQVILIEVDDAGAGSPKPRGVTPTTLEDLAEGKYTVHLERPGYKSFQKNVKVVANETVKVTAKLKKE